MNPTPWLDWTQVLSLCNVLPPAQTFLPSLSACPLCQGERLRACQDPQRPAPTVWFHCPDCHFGGDAVELLAAWRSATAQPHRAALQEALETVTSLAAAGNAAVQADPGGTVAPLEEDYLTDGPLHRQRLRAGWQTCCRRDLSPALSGLISRRHSALASWCGSGTPRFFEALLRPRRCSRQRPFAGHRWSEALAVACWDLPGRIGGFFFAGTSATGRETFYSPIQRGSESTRVVPAAYAFLPQLPASTSDFGTTVFVVVGLLEGLRVQGRNSRQGGTPLPLVACPADPGPRALRYTPEALGRRPVIVWAPALCWHAVAVARSLNGLLATGSPERIDGGNDSLPRRLNRLSPRRWLEETAGSARPWEDSVAALAAGADDFELGAQLRRLSTDPEDYRLLCAQLQRRQALPDERWQRLEPPDAPRRVLLSGHAVCEEAGRWLRENLRPHRAQSQRVLVADAVVRVDRLVHRPPRSLAAGRILYRDQEYPFEVEAAMLSREGFRWVAAFLLRQGAGVLHYHRPSRRACLELASLFQEPARVEGIDRCGWSSSLGSWIFPAFLIDSSAPEGWRPCQRLVPTPTDPQPFARAVPPRRLLPHEVRLLTKTTAATTAAWGLLIFLAGRCLSTLHQQAGRSLAIGGTGSARLAAARLATALGCAGPLAAHAPWTRHWLATDQRHHDMPVLLDDSADGGAHRLPPDGLAVTETGSSLRLQSRLQAYRAGLAEAAGWAPWDVLPVPNNLTVPAELLALLPALLPSYLAWLARQQWQLAPRRHYLWRIATSLVSWFQEAGGSAPAVWTGYTRLGGYHAGASPAARHVQRLSAFLQQLRREGKDGFLETIESGKEKGYWLDAEALDRLLRRNGLRPLAEAWTTLKASLRQQHLLLELPSDALRSVIPVKTDLWPQQGK